MGERLQHVFLSLSYELNFKKYYLTSFNCVLFNHNQFEISQKTPDADNDGANSNGKGIYIWDHVTQKPKYTGTDLDEVRFGGVSVKVDNRYLPNCKGNQSTMIYLFW